MTAHRVHPLWFPVALVLATLAGCFAPSREESKAQLAARSEQYEAQVLEQRARLSAIVLRRLEIKKAACDQTGEPLTLDVLAISAGGQYGAFGVGVLQGWQKVAPGPDAIPQFDVVTGVSTGSIIAPFALVGTEQYIRRIDQLYREIDKRLPELQGRLFFLPWRAAFYDNIRLATRIEEEMDDEMLDRVAAAADEARLLLVGTTDIDVGRLRVWEMGLLAHRENRARDIEIFRKVLLASAAIPATFPPVDINGTLYVDGGVSQQTIVGLDRDQIEETIRLFLKRNPGAAMPRVRFWMIVNGSLDVPAQTINLEWIALSRRSIDVMMKYSMRTTLRHLELGVETLSTHLQTPVQFRYICVPDGFVLPETKELFEKELMIKLVELGKQMGADPANWRTSVGSVELPAEDGGFGGGAKGK